MRTLPRYFKKKGITYTQVLRGKRSCVYRQEVNPEIAFFEVFIIKIKPQKIIFGKQIPEREVYPNDEDFGNCAWSFRSLKKARSKFNELEDRT